MPKLQTTTPIFRIFDLLRAREFYLDYLDFDLVFEHRFAEGMPLYMGLKRDAVTLHLSEHHGDCTPGSAIRIELDDIDTFHANLTKKGYGFANPAVEPMPWGSREMSITDPFGNRITFFQTNE